MNDNKRFSSSAGIAIGPILFVLAILALLAAVIAAGGSDFTVAGGADRITADITAQANLIRNTINDCNLQYTLAVSTNPNQALSISDTFGAFPVSDTTNGTAVSALLCDPTGGGALWNNTNSANNILLPPATNGFNPWTYINANATGGGRCFWTSPITPGTTPTVVSGLTRAANKFDSSTTVTANSEVVYDPTKTAQKFIVWITMPSSPSSADPHCQP